MRLGPAGVGGGYGFDLSQDETGYVLGFFFHWAFKVKGDQKAIPS